MKRLAETLIARRLGENIMLGMSSPRSAFLGKSLGQEMGFYEDVPKGDEKDSDKTDERSAIREGVADQWQRQLEDMIDASNLANVLTLLSGVCYEKEEHVQTNWQDDATARTWHRDGKTIDSIVSRITN